MHVDLLHLKQYSWFNYAATYECVSFQKYVKKAYNKRENHYQNKARLENLFLKH